MTLYNNHQNDILNTMDIEYVYSDKPINRIKTKLKVENKTQLLINLKNKIKNIENCELKKNSNNIVFADGNQNSNIMLVGEAPGLREDETSKPFVGDAGILLNKMLSAIDIKREDVYITNVVNYRPLNNKKPSTIDILRYSEFLKEHIMIINPKILVLMGSTAMEALIGPKMKITKERGIWKEIKISDKIFNTIITFHPAFLLRQPEQKKYSWIDLKKIKEKINNLGVKF